MSQGVFGWRAKATGLGLLISLAVLSGATCLPPSLDPTDPGSNSSAQTTPISVTVLSPLADTTIQAGATIQIAWSTFTNGQAAQLTVFYDTDNNANNGVHNLTVLDVSSPTAPTQYNWITTGMASGTYYVGAQLSDGTNSVVSYAIGRVIVSSVSITNSELDLRNVGTAFKGCVFEGFSFAGSLGQVMTGRFDISSIHGTVSTGAGGDPRGKPDGVSDFVLVAPTADSFYAQEPNVGEAYTVFGWNSRTEARPAGWYNGAHFSVNSIGTDPAVPGFIMVGPSYITSSTGITSLQPVADRDGDGGSELMIGVTEIVGGKYEDQVYQFTNPYAPFNYTQIGYLTRTGYMTMLGSQSFLFDVGAQLGHVIHVDEIGQLVQNHEDHPRMIAGNPGPPAAPWAIYGLRWYQRTRLPLYYDFHNNFNRFSQSLGTEDIDGDGLPEWLVGSPGTDDDLGNIELIYGYSTNTWVDQPLSVCRSWPYTPFVNVLVWPTINWDQVRADPYDGVKGQLGNPTGVGDFNNDGFNDIAMSAYLASPGSQAEAGIAYLVFGRAPFGDHALSEIKNPSVQDALPGIMISGTEAGDHVGYLMTAMGRPNWGMPGHPKLRDFNGDGVPDWVISAPGRNVGGKANTGAIAIIWGNTRKDGRFTWDQITTPDLPGIIITGANQGDQFGTYMVEAGDVNGDGGDDLIVSAPGAENPLTGAQDTGAVYVIYGPPSGTDLIKYENLSGTYNINDLINNKGPIKVRVYYGSVQGHRVGPVAGAGDIDNDGYEDILIADPSAAPLGRTGAGQVYVIFGSNY